MIFKQLNPGGCRTYLVASERTREAVLVDPLLEGVDAYLELLRSEKLKLRWVLDTHTHADHLSGGAAVQKKAGVDYLMHFASPVQCVSKRLRDGAALGLGELTLDFVHVPGHTRDSLLILMGDRFLSGDFLFIGRAGAGRLDLPGGDADAHYESLRKLDRLSDDVLMFPAHDYRGRTSSSLKAERAANPVLSPRSRDEYLRWWKDLHLGPAEWMKEVLNANAAGVCEPGSVQIPKEGSACEACAPGASASAETRPGRSGSALDPAPAAIRECAPAEFHKTLASGKPVVIDVREPDEYAGELGHIRGSRLIPLGTLGGRLGEVPKDRPVVTVCKMGGRSRRAAQQLLAAGCKDVSSLAGGMEAWNEANLPVEYGPAAAARRAAESGPAPAAP